MIGKVIDWNKVWKEKGKEVCWKRRRCSSSRPTGYLRYTGVHRSAVGWSPYHPSCIISTGWSIFGCHRWSNLGCHYYPPFYVNSFRTVSVMFDAQYFTNFFLNCFDSRIFLTVYHFRLRRKRRSIIGQEMMNIKFYRVIGLFELPILEFLSFFKSSRNIWILKSNDLSCRVLEKRRNLLTQWA